MRRAASAARSWRRWRRAATTCSASTSVDGCDVTDEADCEAAVAEAVRRFGGLDGLVNNAGIVSVTRGGCRSIPSEEWDRVMAVNAKGTWLMTRAAIPAMETAARS